MSKKLDKIPVKLNIKVKEQDKGYMIFNLDTSGFHLLQKDGIDVLEKVDGSRTIKEISEIVSEEKNEPLDKVQEQLLNFFEGLEKRKIIKWK